MNLLRRYSLPLALLAAAALFALLAGRFAVLVRPNSNEGWFADAARNLLYHGRLGVTILASQGTWLEGIDRHTYWAMPVHLLVQAAWYAVFGFSLLSLRWLSIAASLLMILAWYVVASRLTLNRIAALAAVFLVAADPRISRWGSTGRMDALCAGLGVAGLAFYLYFRERSPRRAIAGGHTLMALSGLTHPCGAVYACDLLLLQLLLDGWRASLQQLRWLLAPYLTLGGAFLVWALQDWPSFLRQFGGNISGVASQYSDVDRFSAFSEPWNAIPAEFQRRFYKQFQGRISSAVLGLYAASYLWLLLRRSWRPDAPARPLFALATLHFLFFSFFEGLKLGNYLVHALPVLILLVPFAGSDFFRTRPKWQAPAYACVLLLVLISANRELRERSFQALYEPAVARLRAYPDARIMAPAEFAFALGFEGRLQDDPRLGAFTGREADLYVTNDWLRAWLMHAQYFDPGAEYAMAKLQREYRLVYRNPMYQIWEHVR